MYNGPFSLFYAAANALHRLSAHFKSILIVDSDPLQAALHRQRMIFGNTGKISVVKNALPQGTPVDELLLLNVRAASKEVNFAMHHPIEFSRPPKRLRSAKRANNETRQLELLPEPSSREARANSVNRKRMIAAPKSKSAAEI